MDDVRMVTKCQSEKKIRNKKSKSFVHKTTEEEYYNGK